MKYFTIILAIVACQSPQAPENQKIIITQKSPELAAINRDSIPCPETMLENPTDTIPPNLYAPKTRYDFCGWWMPEDTITPNGNFVNYMISNDTCCRDYLYLAWGNKQFRGLENLGPLRRFHPKMNPEYIGESKEYLFLESAASGGMPIVGWSLWLFPLTKAGKYEVYTTIAPEAFDLKSLTILREIEENRDDFYALEAYNIRTKRTKQIRFKNKLGSASPAWAIDSVSITPKSIFVRVETLNKRDEIVLENIFLPNDIK